MDRFESMTVFLAVVDTGSLSAAGRKLGMPLATVSRKLGELETHLKARLLNRSTRQLTLTDAGKNYVVACRRVLEDLDDAERTAAGEYSAPRGELIITAPLAFGRLHVLPIVTDFLRAYPEVDVRLVLGDRVLSILDDHVDLAVRIGVLPDSSLSATQVGTIRRIICGSPNYFAEHGTPTEPQDLSKHPCITFDAVASPDAWSFISAGKETIVPIHSRLTVNSAEAAVDAAIAGIGVTRLLSYQAMAAQRSGLLETVLREFESAPIPVNFVFNNQRRLALKLRAFIDYAAPLLRARLE